MITHGPPAGVLDGDQGFESLLRAVARAKPRLHCFGKVPGNSGAVYMIWPEGRKSHALPNPWPLPWAATIQLLRLKLLRAFAIVTRDVSTIVISMVMTRGDRRVLEIID
jgi:hypothetical protein